jgi:hypothetical protein
MLHVIFWVIPLRVVFNSRRFGPLCLFNLHRRVDINPKDYTQHLEHGESLKSRTVAFGGFSRIFLLGILIFKGGGGGSGEDMTNRTVVSRDMLRMRLQR